ncbi:MAG TPA: DHA2 family efflux MFS transporter permease subunit [Thermoleophilaceae bacterium]|nr:DHA2 family efflux MFS transporter permease subunit [Thermoleophilaceae bacterium]
MTEARKRLVLIAAILGTTVVTVDATVVNVALPAIADDLGGGLAGQQWTSNAYLVTLGSLLLIGGSLGDLFGERRMFATGVLGFGVTSVFCALAPTIELLVVARALQGVAGALLTPAALAVIVTAFPPAERGKAVGAWTAWGGIGTVLGPLIGGQLVDTASWRWIFAINIPIVIVTLVLVFRAVPEGRERPAEARVDVVGGLLCAFGLAAMTFGLIEQPLRGWGDPAVALPLVIGALLFAGFLVWEARSQHPMLPLALFRRRNFAIGNIETFSMYAGLGLLFFFLVLFLQQVAGYSALAAGTASLPVTIVMFLLSMRFGMLADRHGPRFFMGVGPLVAALGLAWFLRLGADVDYLTDLLPGLLVFALGLSMTVAPLTATVLADADERNAGIASGVNNAIARVASLVAIAAVGALVAASFGSSLDDELGDAASRPDVAPSVEQAKKQPLAEVVVEGAPEGVQAEVADAAEDASVSAFHVGIGIATVLVALGGVLGLVGIVNPRRRVEAVECRGGQLVGATVEGSRQSPSDWPRQARECGTPAPAASSAPAA